jgi:SEC-C motif
MGAIADAFVAYAQPLIDQTDGSEEQLNKAFAITQLCYNLALLPEDQREKLLSETRQSLKMDDAEFAEFRRSVIDPMIRRHEAMFPGLHARRFGDSAPSSSSSSSSPRTPTSKATPGNRYPGTDRYAPCPCGSGEKYKFCCGPKGR